MIPHLIHQTWKIAEVPSHLRPLQGSWQAHHADWEYRLWTDADNREFLKKHYRWFLPIFDQYPENIMRVDAARYFILAHYGGVYVDLDMLCLQPLDDLLAERDLVLVPEPPSHLEQEVVRQRRLQQIMSNAFIASSPGHPFWQLVFAELIARHGSGGPLDATGPFLLTQAYDSYEHRDTIELIPSSWVYPQDNSGKESSESKDKTRVEEPEQRTYAIHYWNGSWVRPTQRRSLLQVWCNVFRRFRDRGERLLSTLRGIIKPILREKIETVEILTRPSRLKIKRRLGLQPQLEDWSPFDVKAHDIPVRQRVVNTRQRASAIRRPAQLDAYPSILILCPVKNASQHLERFWYSLCTLSYPRDRISLAHLVSDSDDGTYDLMQQRLSSLSTDFARVEVYEQNFDYRWRLSRWEPSEQPRRRAILAKSRNHLLSRALGDEEWVLWIDVDVVSWPSDIIEQLLATKKGIVAPNCVDEQGNTYDLNSFRFKPDADKIDWNRHSYNGVMTPPPNLGRLYLSDLRHYTKVPLDGVGATMLLVKADIHREGLIFPPYSYRGLIETEGLAAMAKDMGYTCWGLPHVEVVHPVS